jgi:ribose transport system permease protein
MAAVIARRHDHGDDWLIPVSASAGASFWPAWRQASCLGGVAGVGNGIMITRGRIEAFIVTLGTMASSARW